MKSTFYGITPVPKPRQTRSDKWKERPCVMRYRAFKDKVRLLKMGIPESGAHLIFYLPMPKSWSKKKKIEMQWEPHQQKPDVDNILKSCLDAVHDDDSGVFDIRCSKYWAVSGRIEIRIPED